MANPTVTKQRSTMTRKRLMVIGILTVIVALFVLFSSYGVFTRFGLESDKGALNARIAAERRVEDSLRAEMHQLVSDTTEIERLARENYGYVRHGEEVYIIKRDSSQ